MYIFCFCFCLVAANFRLAFSTATAVTANLSVIGKTHNQINKHHVHNVCDIWGRYSRYVLAHWTMGRRRVFCCEYAIAAATQTYRQPTATTADTVWAFYSHFMYDFVCFGDSILHTSGFYYMYYHTVLDRMPNASAHFDGACVANNSAAAAPRSMIFLGQ